MNDGKINYNKEQKVLYGSKRKVPFFVQVPEMKYLRMDGIGHPSEEDFQIVCDALYTTAYTIKFEIARKELNLDFKINPMEITWNLNKKDGKTDFTWTMMLMQPEFVTKEIVERALQIIKDKGKSIAFDRIAFSTYEFGKCIQCFHQGDYNKMNDTLEKMRNFAKENHVICDQYTHDIYLNDMRKTKVENYQTIMRIRVHQA